MVRLRKTKKTMEATMYITLIHVYRSEIKYVEMQIIKKHPNISCFSYLILHSFFDKNKHNINKNTWLINVDNDPA